MVLPNRELEIGRKRVLEVTADVLSLKYAEELVEHKRISVRHAQVLSTTS